MKTKFTPSVFKRLIFIIVLCVIISSCSGDSGNGLEHEIALFYIEHPEYNLTNSELIIAKFSSVKVTRTDKDNKITESKIIYLTQSEIDQLNGLMNPFDSSLDSTIILSGPNNGGGGGAGYGISIDGKNFPSTQYDYPQYIWSDRISKIYSLVKEIVRNRYESKQIGKKDSKKSLAINLDI